MKIVILKLFTLNFLFVKLKLKGKKSQNSWKRPKLQSFIGSKS